MKRVLFVIAVFFSILISTSFAQKDMSKYKSEIEKINEKLKKAMLSNQMNEIVEFYTEDAVSLPSYQPMLKGKSEIKAQVEKDSKQDEMKLKDINFKTIELFGNDEMLYEIGTYDLTMEMKNMEEPYNDKGKYLTVWVKQNNQWKIKSEMWNTDKNPWQEMQNQNEGK